MHGKLEYFARHAVKKALGLLPGGFLIQEFTKRAIGHWDRVATEKYIRSKLLLKVSRFNVANIGPPRVVVEQGTGWLGLDLVLFHLAGADCIVTYDTRPWLRPDLLRRNAEVLASSTEILKRWNGTDPARVDERAERIKHVLNDPWPTFLEHLGVRIRVTRSMDRSEIEPGSVDLFYSDSVLEFADPRDIATLVRQARRFLRPSGLSFHVIDCFDRNDQRIHRLAYLGYPELVWHLMTSKYLNYQNRLRMPEFAELFRRDGLPSRIANPVVTTDDLEYVRSRLAHDPRFRDMRQEDIATSSFWLIGPAR